MIGVELKRQLEKYYQIIEEINDDVVKAIRLYKGRPYQIFYFDISGSISPEKLGDFLKTTITDDYFADRSSMQWNYYIVFLVEHEIDVKSKFVIESDLDFARKFVLLKSTVSSWLERFYEVGDKFGLDNLEKGLPEIWESQLRKHGLDFLVEVEMSLDIGVERILSGETITSFVDGNDSKIADVELNVSAIEELQLFNYRQYPNSELGFRFGKVNLISGANGHGKTSLLEAIEYFYTGRNFRNDSASSGVSYKIGVKVVGEKSYRLSTDNRSVLEKRDTVWYNSTDRKKGVGLSINFNRYNFYNTDASFRLSLNKDEFEIENAFRDLALGEEVNRLKLQLDNYQQRLYSELKVREKLKEEHEKEIEEAAKIINQLSRTKDDFFKMFEGLNDLLADSIIRIPSYNAELPNPEDIRRQLNSFNKNLKDIVSEINWLPTLTLKSVSDEHITLNEVVRSLLEINVSITASKEKIKQIEEDKSENLLMIGYLFEFQSLTQKGMSKEDSRYKDYLRLEKLEKSLLKDYEQIKEHAKARYASLNSTIREYMEQFGFRQRDLKVSQAIARRDTIRAREHMAAVEDIVSQINDFGSHYLMESPYGCICPLCKTEFESLENLKRSINKDLKLWKERQNFEDAKRTEQSLEIDVHYLSLDFEKVRSLGWIAGKERYNSNADLTNAPISEVIRLIDTQIRSKLEDADALLNEKIALINWGDERSRELSRLEYLSKQTSKNFAKKDLDSPSKIREIISNLNDSIFNLNRERVDHSEALVKLFEKRHRFLSSIAVMESQKVEELLLERSEKLNNYAEKITSNKFFKYNPDTDFQEILLQSERLFEFVDRVCYELTISVNGGSVSQQALQTIDNRKNSIERIELEINRLGTALDTIKSMNISHSEEDHLNSFFLKNKEQIKSIFLTVHAPKEFVDITIGGNTIQLHKTNGEIAGLSTISTGQRSALALAVFLTLNSKVKKGPQLIIFDDPLAFTDDLNVLSFLDYLREIILNLDTQKQLFFATSNDNLAFLFRKKFEILGDDYQNIILKR